MKLLPIEAFEDQMKKKSDQVINYFLSAYFFIGILCAFYYNTWLIAMGVGGGLLVVYFIFKRVFSTSHLYQYILSIVMGAFTYQFVYQTHGMIEMYFFALIGSAILITYRNWKLQLPLAGMIVFYQVIQYSNISGLYFLSLRHISPQNALIDTVLTLIIFSICGLWAHNIKMAGDRQIIQSLAIGKLEEANKQKEVLVAMSENLRISNERLQEVNKELRTIFNAIDEVLFSIDLTNGRIIQLSAACEKISGWTRTDFMADNYLWSKLLHPEDQQLIAENTQKLKQGKTVLCQCRINHKNNSIKWLEVKIIPSFDNEGKMIRLDSIVKDITERKQSEVALQESYKQILSQKLLMRATEKLARFGSWQLDINEEAVKWSDEAFGIYGYGPGEHEPSYEFFLNHVHPDDLDYVQRTMAYAYLHLSTQKLSFRIVDRKGHIKHLEAELTIERNEQGEPVRLTGFKQDVTERVMLEKSLAEERKCKQKEITAAVINAQEQERSFLGEELHDNINPILATAKLYMDSAIENEDIRITLIQNTKEFISAAMNDIRKLSKSLLPPSLGEISLKEALNDMIENINKVHDLNFIKQWHGFNEVGMSDKQKLTIFRISQEQITNIIKHAQAKNVTISLKKEKGHLELSIKDDGVGFDTKVKRNGVGLQNISSRAELYNGKVSIHSQIGKGCELVVNFNNETIPARNNIAKAS